MYKFEAFDVISNIILNLEVIKEIVDVFWLYLKILNKEIVNKGRW